MKTGNDLGRDSVPSLVLKLAIPTMVAQFVNVLYSIIDRMYIGHIQGYGDLALAGAGVCGPIVTLLSSFGTLVGLGGSIQMSIRMGEGNTKKARQILSNSLLLLTLFSAVLTVLFLMIKGQLLRWFGASEQTFAYANTYLTIYTMGTFFALMAVGLNYFINCQGFPVIGMTTVLIGTICNIILDPVLIFGLGPFPAMRIMGAAVATVIAQAIVTLTFLIFTRKDTLIFPEVHFFGRPNLHYLTSIIKIGLPTSIQSMLFTGISMIIARLVAGYGDAAVAVQKVGSQIESISWMTADGFAAAVNSFIAQNHGAGNRDRIRKGYSHAMGIVLVWGIFCTLLLILCPEPIFRIFITEPDVIPMGVDYLMILGVSQLFMSVEITTAGAFSGYGRTVPPSVISIIFTSARIPLAMLLITTSLALNGIWWSITISSIFKGILLLTWFLFFLRKEMKKS